MSARAGAAGKPHRRPQGYRRTQTATQCLSRQNQQHRNASVEESPVTARLSGRVGHDLADFPVGNSGIVVVVQQRYEKRARWIRRCLRYRPWTFVVILLAIVIIAFGAVALVTPFKRAEPR